MVKPVGLLGQQRRLGAHVVGDEVEHQLHVAGVELVGEFAQVGFGAEAGLDGVRVGDPVAVVRAPGAMLVRAHREDGGQPQRLEAELVQVRDLLDDPPQVAAVEALRVGGIGVGVVAGVAVVEAVDHREVDGAVAVVGGDGRVGTGGSAVLGSQRGVYEPGEPAQQHADGHHSH